MIKVFIDGSAGTTGLRIEERMRSRSDVSLLTLPDSQRKDPAAKREMINRSDYVFLCLPDEAATESASLVDAANSTTCLIDASTAHRTNPGWAYGLPELSPGHRADIQSSKRIAVPGCHAGGFCAVVYPLTAQGVIPPDYNLSCFSLSGYSGAGKAKIAEYETPSRPQELSSPGIYAMSQSHKHLPEMKAACGLSAPPVFIPVINDFYSGMIVSVPLQLGIPPKKLHEIYEAHYANQPLIAVKPFCPTGTESGFLFANSLSGTDRMEIIVAGTDDRSVVYARFCNLGKGASGAAVQCFNINSGAEETTGLVL